MKKLSVCMMVKNEEENLGRCLSSIVQLKNYIDMEIIIVDTGSTDNTIKIAREYTERIYEHQWNNDFSAMRNKSISYAEGEWILIIDADEELMGHESIVGFLNHNQGSNVAGAALRLYNIKDRKTYEKGAQLITPRIFRKTSGIQYEGRVHNMPMIRGDIIELNDVIYHYGYIVSDKELMTRKFERTKALLQEELVANPQSVYYQFQLSVSYDMYGDQESAYQEVKKAYELICDMKPEEKYQFIYIYASYVKLANNSGEFEHAIKIANEGLALEKEYVDLMFFKAIAHFKIGQLEEAIQSYEKYLFTVSNFENTKIRYNPSIQHYTLNSSIEAFCNLSILYRKLGDDKNSYRYMIMIFDKEDPKSIYFDSIFDIYVEMLSKFEDIERLSHLCLRTDLAKDQEDRLLKGMTHFLIQQTLNKKDEGYQLLEKLLCGNGCNNESEHTSMVNKVVLLQIGITKSITLNDLVNLDLWMEYAKSNGLLNDIIELVEQLIPAEPNEDELFKHIYRHMSECPGSYGELNRIKLEYLEKRILNSEKNAELLLQLWKSNKDCCDLGVLLLLSNMELTERIDYLLSETEINSMLSRLINYKSIFKELQQSIFDMREGSNSKIPCSRIHRNIMKIRFMQDKTYLSNQDFMCYFRELENYLKQKYTEEYIYHCNVEDLYSAEEAFGVMLLRSGFPDKVRSFDLILESVKHMPSMASQIKNIIQTNQDLQSEKDDKIKVQSDGLVRDLIREIMRLAKNDNLLDAKLILQEALNISPENKELLEIQASLNEPQMTKEN